MSHYSKYWDRYVTELFPRAGRRDGVCWPGDEWGGGLHWKRVFEALFVPYGVERWEAAVEIGQGAGKYTKPVMDAAPGCVIAAFDVSSEFLKVCGERLADEKAAGRLHLAHLRGERADEMILEIERLGLSRRLDAFFSIDAMVHVDLQYLVAYWLTASLTLKPGGHLIMTLADASSDVGCSVLLNKVTLFYSDQGKPTGKFEWLGKDIVKKVLGKMGFTIVRLDNAEPPHRDLCLVARLTDPSAAYEVSMVLSEADSGRPKARRWPTASVPVLEWPPIEGARSYRVEFSRDKFGTMFEALPPVSVTSVAPREYALPNTGWESLGVGHRLHWRVVACCDDRQRIAARGILVRTDEPPPATRPRRHSGHAE
jgi:hypothetical protein